MNKKKPAGYWTKERCYQEANKYTTRNEFLKGSASAYQIAQRNGWLDEVCANLSYVVKPPRYWTKERCASHANKYQHRNDFFLHVPTAYRSAQRNGWLDDICAHMVYQVLPRNYWTKERVQKEANKYTSRTKFLNAAKSAYGAAQSNGWLDEVCQHMTVVDHGWLHCLYVIYNKRINKAYVGQTRQAFDIRMEQHQDQSRNTTFSRHIAFESDTVFEQLTGYEFSVNEVIEKETEFYQIYKDLGYELLNDAIRLGYVGSSNRWTKERCVAEAAKYKTNTEFRTQSPSAYRSAKRNGWLETIQKSLVITRKPNGYWSKDRCAQEALQYHARTDFLKSQAGQAAKTRGWVDDVAPHLKPTRKPSRDWTYEECLAEAKKYVKRGEFHAGSSSAFIAAKKNGWLDDVCQHMVSKRKSWTYDECRELALKYETKKAFKQGESGAYNACLKHKWIKELCAHMDELLKPSGYWSKERCADVASLYTRTTEFCKNAGNVYSTAKRMGWFDDITAHMTNDTQQRTVRGFWKNKDNCAAEALKYKSKHAFKKSSRGAYASARKHAWLEDICQHMEISQVPMNHWKNKENCFNEARKYKTKSQFIVQAKGAYAAAKRYGWLDEIYTSIYEV